MTDPVARLAAARAARRAREELVARVWRRLRPAGPRAKELVADLAALLAHAADERAAYREYVRALEAALLPFARRGCKAGAWDEERAAAAVFGMVPCPKAEPPDLFADDDDGESVLGGGES